MYIYIYVCIHVCTCMFIYTIMYVYTCSYTPYMYIPYCIYVYCIFIYTCTYMALRGNCVVDKYIYIYTHMNTCIYVLHTNMSICHICKYVHTYIHVHMRLCMATQWPVKYICIYIFIHVCIHVYIFIIPHVYIPYLCICSSA